jgi:hypothetical protein
MADANHEQPSQIRCADQFVSIEDNRSASLDRDPRQTSRSCQSDGAPTDRRPVSATFLTGFRDFDQHAARPFAAERCAPTQELVSPLYRFDPEHQALLDDDCLADVESPQRPSNAQPALDIRLRLRIRLNGTERAFSDELPIQKLIDAEHTKTLVLKLAYDGRQQAVIANRTVTDSGEQLGRPPIRAQGAQRWAPDTTGQDEFGHIVFTQ